LSGKGFILFAWKKLLSILYSKSIIPIPEKISRIKNAVEVSPEGQIDKMKLPNILDRPTINLSKNIVFSAA